ncbi:MAG: VCBS repeat-containing protein, partial [Candidatus Aegiribacteria sp.]|nr:VCBS repeat-containing protein [Candidatus Aegiribacteria sp.]
MFRNILTLLISGSLIISYADYATQSDWSGGSGVSGPVLEFGNSFSSFSNLDWGGVPGILRITSGVIETEVDTNFDGAHSVHSIDVDGDGDWDVICAAYNANEIAWWDNVDGTGSTWIKHVIDDSFMYSFSTYGEDIDGDGDYDVVGAAYDANEVTWWENEDGSGLTWTTHLISGTVMGASAVYSEDVDDDGDMDILCTARLGDEVTWWENADGSGQIWIEHIIETGFNGARSIYCDDIDGDGDMDVLAAAVIEDEIKWWENLDHTGTSWSGHSIASGFNGACAVYLDDIDNDGDLDALGAAVHDDEMVWWENADGTGSDWIAHIIDNYFNGAHSIISADLDNDGDQDIIGTAEQADDVTWWENTDSTGTTWCEHLIDGDFDGAEWAWPVDIDDDGYLEILAVAESDDAVCFWDPQEFTTAGSLESSILDTETYPLWDYLDWNSDI